MKSNTSRPRPLSPHLGIYRLLITSVTSITHRFTGIALSAGLLMLTAWLGVLAFCPENYPSFTAFCHSIIGTIILVGFTLAFFYHLSNGIRHLIWDMGVGFELKTINKTGPLVIALAIILTAITWTII